MARASGSKTASSSKRKASSSLSDLSEEEITLQAPSKSTATKPKAKRTKVKSVEATKKDEDEEEEAGTEKKVKAPSKSKKTTAPVVIDHGMPTNKVLPVSIQFAPPESGAIRISSWNVCGLGASQKKGFKHYVEAEDPDILILTETKVNNKPVDPFLMAKYPHQYWSISDTKTYAGTAVLSKIQPLTTTFELPGHEDVAVAKGRIVTLEFDSLYVIGTYVPNAGEKLKTMDRKQAWNSAFETYIRSLDKKKPVVWTGDLNVAPTAIDLKNSKTNWNKSAGHTAIEVDAFNQTLAPAPDDKSSERLVDVWRERNPDIAHYTYFSYRFNCREKNIGWRLDYFVTSERLLSRIKACEIRHEIWGASDHLPIILELTGPL